MTMHADRTIRLYHLENKTTTQSYYYQNEQLKEVGLIFFKIEHSSAKFV